MTTIFEKVGLRAPSFWKATTELGGKAMTTVPPLARESEHANVDVISRVLTKPRQDNRQHSAATILTGYFPKLLKQIQVHVAGDQSTGPLQGWAPPNSSLDLEGKDRWLSLPQKTKWKQNLPARKIALYLHFKLVITSRIKFWLLCKEILITFSILNTALKILSFRVLRTLLLSLATTSHFSPFLTCFLLSFPNSIIPKKKFQCLVENWQQG